MKEELKQYESEKPYMYLTSEHLLFLLEIATF